MVIYYGRIRKKSPQIQMPNHLPKKRTERTKVFFTTPVSPSNISAPLIRPSTGNADKKMQGIQNGLDFFLGCHHRFGLGFQKNILETVI